MNGFSHGSLNHVVRTPATSANPATMNSTPLASSAARVDTTSSHNNATCVNPRCVTLTSGGSPTSTDGYSMISSTRSESSSTPTIAALTTTGDGTNSPMSREMSAPSMRRGGDNTTSPST